MFMTDESLWAEEQFQFCNLGDKRRTDRLIELAKSLCKNIGKSLSYSCEGDRGELEGSQAIEENNIKKLTVRNAIEKQISLLQNEPEWSFFIKRCYRLKQLMKKVHLLR
ncbi:hypothetical protein E3983_11675 [Legionella israelensis]|uniref:Transposase Tn5-like N-terminal domain-containing protein n=1 Tax=Legionella israelensis TaxID=454 RepID=A0AAX1EIS0_9GAMM|nr:hypothetical protein E3983_11675 [Legionella israelensis]